MFVINRHLTYSSVLVSSSLITFDHTFGCDLHVVVVFS